MFAVLTLFAGKAMLAIESISVHRISHCLALEFQSARIQAVGPNINCIISSASGGHVGRFVSDVCDQTAIIIKNKKPNNSTTDRFAFIMPQDTTLPER